MITPSNIARHELIGLRVTVSESSDRKLAGLDGKVVDESRNMLVIESGGSEKNVTKDRCTFKFFLPDPGVWVKVDGSVLVARPEDRIKKKLKKW